MIERNHSAQYTNLGVLYGTIPHTKPYMRNDYTVNFVYFNIIQTNENDLLEFEKILLCPKAVC